MYTKDGVSIWKTTLLPPTLPVSSSAVQAWRMHVDAWIIKEQSLSAKDTKACKEALRGPRAQLLASLLNASGNGWSWRQVQRIHTRSPMGYVDHICPPIGVWRTENSLALAMASSTWECMSRGEIRMLKDGTMDWQVHRGVESLTLYTWIMNEYPYTLLRVGDMSMTRTKRLAARKQFYRRLTSIVWQILMALRALQSGPLRMVHGDLHPKNVFLVGPDTALYNRLVPTDGFTYRVCARKEHILCATYSSKLEFLSSSFDAAKGKPVDVYSVPIRSCQAPLVWLGDFGRASSDRFRGLEPKDELKRWHDPILVASSIRSTLALCGSLAPHATVDQCPMPYIAEFDRLLRSIHGPWALGFSTHNRVCTWQTLRTCMRDIPGSLLPWETPETQLFGNVPPARSLASHHMESILAGLHPDFKNAHPTSLNMRVLEPMPLFEDTHVFLSNVPGADDLFRVRCGHKRARQETKEEEDATDTAARRVAEDLVKAFELPAAAPPVSATTSFSNGPTPLPVSNVLPPCPPAPLSVSNVLPPCPPAPLPVSNVLPPCPPAKAIEEANLFRERHVPTCAPSSFCFSSSAYGSPLFASPRQELWASHVWN
jgi:hypothetical protein